MSSNIDLGVLAAMFSSGMLATPEGRRAAAAIVSDSNPTASQPSTTATRGYSEPSPSSTGAQNQDASTAVGDTRTRDSQQHSRKRSKSMPAVPEQSGRKVSSPDRSVVGHCSKLIDRSGAIRMMNFFFGVNGGPMYRQVFASWYSLQRPSKVDASWWYSVRECKSIRDRSHAEI